MKKLLKILSVVLTVVLIIGIFSCATPVFAAEVTEKDSIESTLEQYKSQVENSENKSLYEIKEERDEFTKVFQNSDGTKTAIVSATPVHYETDNGWEDIDNTLIEESKVTGNVYKNKKNDFTVTIPQELTSGKDLKIEKDNYSISFELEGSDLFSKNKKIKGNKKAKNIKSTVKQNEIDTDFLDKTSGVSFQNVGENTSVEYEVTSTGLKENIILNKKPEGQVIYKYKITAKKLDAQFNADNSVTFKNAEGKAVFEIPAPVMYDAKNNISNEIEVEFSGKNGKYTLIYKPSFEWLTSDLTYPVVIDPVVDTISEGLGVKDAVVDSGHPNNNYGNTQVLYTYKSDTGSIQSFIDISSNYIVKNGAKIKTVLLGLYYENGVFIDDSTTVAAYTVTSDWSESDLTYTNRPTTVNSLIERKEIKRGRSAGYILFDVTKAYTLKQDTYGVCIRQRDSVENKAQLIFSSSETPTESQKPYFIIEYYETQGVEEQFDYHAFDAGRAGTAYFNDFTEQVYIERDELGLSGINMPVQIKRYFNSGLGGTYAINHYALSGLTSIYGFGWLTNYHQMIEYHNEIDSNEAILYCNGDGQTVYFEKIITTTDSDTVITWKEKPDKFSNSEGYTLEIPDEYNGVEANSLQYVKIKDSSGQTYEFNSSGLLTKIITAETDSTKNISITYAENGYLISKITDGVGREYRFTYTTYEEWLFPLLTSIQAYSPSGSAITVTHNGASVPYEMIYTYEFSNYLGVDGLPILSSATYPDGETVYYSVSDNLISLKNIDGYAVEFAFNDSNTVISEKVYKETEIVNGGQLTITDENSYEKTFVDLNGTKITKQFDMYGRTINTKNNNNVTESVPRIYSDDYKAQGSVSYSFYNTYEQGLTGDETNLVTNSSFTTNLSGWTVSDSEYVKRNSNADYKKGDETPGYLQLKCEPDEIQSAEQIIDIENGVAGDEYRLDYFVKNTTHSHMVLELLYWDTIMVEARNNVEGTGSWETVAWVDANPFNDNWQKYSYAFDVDFEYNEIRIIVAFYFQYGTVWYDDISLVKTYQANANQNPDTETDNEDTGSNDDNSNTIGCDCDGCNTQNCPCTVHSDTCTEPTCNRGYNFENKSSGIRFSLTDGEKTMAMEQTVSGNYYGSQKDLNGIYTGYNYDQMNGQLNSMSDGNNVTSFSYDAMSRLNKVSNDVDGLISDNKMETSYSYENDRIKSITHNGFSYNYEYDDWGNPSAVKVGTQSLVFYEYGDEENNNPKYRDRLNCITYGNGDYTVYTYNDADGNITSIESYTADGTLVADYVYGYADGHVQTITNVLENTKIEYTDAGWKFYNLSKSSENAVYSNGVNDKNKSVEIFNGIEYNELEQEVSNEPIAGTSTSTLSSQWGDTGTNKYSFLTETDYFGRNQKEEFSFVAESVPEYEFQMGIRTELGYKDIQSTDITEPVKTTSLVESYKSSIGAEIFVKDEAFLEEIGDETEVLLNEYEYFYEYNGNGNITKISSRDVDENNVETLTELHSYVYDKVGQLVRENNAELNKTFVYVYDKGGNIAQKKEYAYTTGDLGEAVSTINYNYDSVWKDKLTAYGEEQIQTDSMGNPLNFVNKNILGDTFEGTLEWNGRQLAAAETDDERYEYSYNSEGLRTSVKKYNYRGELEQIFYYFWQGGKLSGYIVEDAQGNVDYIIKMLYNSAGESFGYAFEDIENNHSTTMLYGKNLQGDVTGVYDAGYGLVVEYFYDAWGNVSVEFLNNSMGETLKSMDIVLYTPITYRGYMYDPFTGLYYLQSRYYNPTYGRFLNADSIMKTGEPLGANIFAYCGNNPVNYVDYDGYSSKYLIDMIVELIILLVVLEAAMRYLFKDVEIDKATKLTQDFNGIYSLSLRYKNAENDRKWLTLEFGDYEAWRNSSSYYNQNTSIHMDSHMDFINEESAKFGMVQEIDALSVLFSDAVLFIEIIAFSIQYSPYKKIFEIVWGDMGLDPDNEFFIFAYRVTGDERFNGVYAYTLTTGTWWVIYL